MPDGLKFEINKINYLIFSWLMILVKKSQPFEFKQNIIFMINFLDNRYRMLFRIFS